MSICPVSRCSAPRHMGGGWAVCKSCADELRKNLAEAPAIARELEITLARLRSNAPRDGGHASPNRLPYVPEASEATWVLRNTLVGWIRDLDENPANHPVDTIEAMATWLLGRMNDLLVHPAAQEVVEEIAAAVGRPVTTRPRHMLPAEAEGADPTPWSRGRAKVGEELYDNPAERMFLGRCPTCEAEDIYAPKGDTVAKCQGCEAMHEVAHLNAGLLLLLSDKLLTVREIAHAYASLDDGHLIRTENLLNRWVERGALRPHGVNLKGREIYPFGEVRGRLKDATTRRSAKVACGVIPVVSF